MAKLNYDFSGWATKYNIPCSDGRTIIRDAFAENDGVTVPLVWNHHHNDANNVLGHALLEKRPEGMYAYCSFNPTPQGKNAKELVKNGDISALSIYANKLKQNGGNVIHGLIREVSLVLAGANPGALIDNVLAHSDGSYALSEDEAEIYSPDDEILLHSDEPIEKEKPMEEENKEVASEKTVKDIFEEMTEEQKTVVYALVGEAHDQGVEEGKKEIAEENNMKHNAFDVEEKVENTEELSHSEFESIVKDGQRYGSLKESFLQHGITNVENLFPEAQSVNKEPKVLGNEFNWVRAVMGGVHHTPFSRIRSTYADITADEARARGYVKNKQKVEEVISAFKRETTPTTVYKLQKMNRDDVIDITDFDVIAWIKGEMRIKLEEELARAYIFGDGRSASSDDKISESNIRPIASDDEVYTIKKQLGSAASTAAEIAATLVDDVVIGLDEYKGAGNPTAFIRKDVFTQLVLLKNKNGERLYKDVKELATAMMVKEIVAVPASIAGNNYAVVVDLADYTVGADKGGAVSLFDDFDINYNKYEYLIETRCSGALTTPKSAVVFTKASE